ncbi:MAG: DNA polymerase III subunit delta [Solirubrobacterales bacterium]
MAEEMKPAYLFSGDDESKIADTRARLRARAEREGGPGALELFTGEGRGAPDPDGLIASLPAMSLIATRRYLLADGVEGWGKTQAARVAEALASIPEQTTVVLIAHGKAPAGLAAAVTKAGGEAIAHQAPSAREMPARLIAEAQQRGFRLEAGAARLLVERLGRSSLRLDNELDRLALWAAADNGEVTRSDLESMVADTSEQAVWSLADAVVSGDERQALSIAERLIAQGENVNGLSYLLSSRLRAAARAAAELEAGNSPKQVADGLSMHPYAAKMLVKRVGGRSPGQLTGAVGAVADLEMWCRGGSDYGEAVALTLALRQATAP